MKLYRFVPALFILLATSAGAQETPQEKAASYTVADYGEALKRGPHSVVRPDEVALDGNIRRMEMSTPLGKVQLQWPRSIETYFGKNPDRAVRDAWNAGARVLSRYSFPTRLQSAKYNWNVVFMDQTPESVAPGLAGGCHPAWMRPPADIFVSAPQVATSCNTERKSSAEANSLLGRALVHELGHAVEFQFAGRGFPYVERWHSEGFATWFEILGGQAFVGKEKVFSRDSFRNQARLLLTPGWRPEYFRGSPDDYMRSYAYIAAIADGRSIVRLGDVYERMAANGVPLPEAVKRELGWDQSQWTAEAIRQLAGK